MADLDLCFTSASELARPIKDGGMSPVEIVASSPARIEEVNGTLNCFCFTYPEEAMAKAREAETAVAHRAALRIGATVEKARPWAERRPDL